MVRNIKKFFIIAIIFLLFFLTFWYLADREEKIVLIPLDSRPCNTQYVELLGQMADLKIQIPYEYLDNYLKQADSKSLWEWLENNAKKANTIMIATNQLFNGGLIHSRDPKSYENIEKDLELLYDFCSKYKKKEIVVINILPRLLPSQFIPLWEYRDGLVHYGTELDKKGKIPESSAIPAEIVKDYLSIYEKSQFITETLIRYTQEGLIDHFLIGQDDAQEYGPSNRIMRDLKPTIELVENIDFLPGADELTMLALAKVKLTEPWPRDLHISYSNYLLKDYYFPYEADTLENSLRAKLNYLGLIVDSTSPNKEIIHTDWRQVEKVLNDVRDFSKEYLGIIDVSYTNTGDKELFEKLFNNNLLKKVDGYAGWNTASNSLGTELAHFAFYQYLQKYLPDYSSEKRELALQAYLKFKYIRLAEDFIYQGFLRENLNKYIEEQGWDSTKLGEHKRDVQNKLNDLFEEFEKPLADGLKGNYILGDTHFEVKNIEGIISLPWERTFEAKVDVFLEID